VIVQVPDESDKEEEKEEAGEEELKREETIEGEKKEEEVEIKVEGEAGKEEEKEKKKEEEEKEVGEEAPPPAPAKPRPEAPPRTPPRKPLTKEDVERIIEEKVTEVFRKFFQPIATEAEEREEIRRRIEGIERSIGAIPTIERRITEEIRRLRRAEEVGGEEAGLPVSLPEPRYEFYYDKWAVIKGYARYGVYVSVDLNTNLALSRLINMPEYYFWYLEYLGGKGAVTDEDRIHATEIFGGNIFEIGTEVFVINKQQPASPMQQSKLLTLAPLDSHLKSALDEHAFIDIRTETWVRRVLDVLYDGQKRLASMTDAEIEDLARELSLESEKRFPGL
jgi:hypothetical protein